MKKIFSLFILALFFLPMVLADGMIIDPYGYLPEKQQVAAINYENGRETMLLSIETDELRSEKSVWLFPVPGDPNQVVIDVKDTFPRFSGSELESQARSNIERVFRATRYTQIYTFFFGIFSPIRTFGGKSFQNAEAAIDISGGDVTVYEHLEKNGITTEIIGADSGLEIYVYLRNKGLEPKFSTIPVLNDYIGQDYSFVISWIQDIEEVNPNLEDEYMIPSYYGKRIGVLVSFPTDEIFYPLKPTSVYGSIEVPATIYVTGLVTPEIYQGIGNYVETRYYQQNNIYALEQLISDYNPSQIKTYTRIDINPPSKLLTEDLIIKQEVSGSVSYSAAIANQFKSNSNTFWIWLFIIGLSALTGTILGLLIFKQPGRFALVGLANCLTIIGLIIAVIFIKTKKIDPKLKKQIKQAGLSVTVSDHKKVIFVIAFSVLFMLLSWLISLLLKAPLQ